MKEHAEVQITVQFNVRDDLYEGICLLTTLSFYPPQSLPSQPSP